MEFSDEPDKGGSKDEDNMGKGPEWEEVFSKSEKRNFRGQGSGKGGKGTGKGGKGGADFRILSQGTKRTSKTDEIFKQFDIYGMPAMIVNEQNVPCPAHVLTDKDKSNEVKRAQQDAFASMHKILRQAHGDLDKARPPCMGQPIALNLR